MAERIAEYHALGIDEFILSGYPHLEEAYQFGEGVIPELRRRGLLAPPNQTTDRPLVADHDRPSDPLARREPRHGGLLTSTIGQPTRWSPAAPESAGPSGG